MADLPTGTVTFLFTDLEGSTRLWEEYPEAMNAALARHDEILREATGSHGGLVVKTTGDGILAAFETAYGGVEAAVAAQRALDEEDWKCEPLRVRMGIHTGEAEQRDGDYFGSVLNRAARLMGVAHGGQIVVSHATQELIGDSLADGLAVRDLGEHRFRDLSRPERVFQLVVPGLVDEFPSLRSLDAYPGNLPVQLTSFVGRDAELREVAEALDAARLVTLTGTGGVGKTRLALQVAAAVLPQFADGAWLCELAAADNVESMLEVVAATLGSIPRPGVSIEVSIVEFLRSKRCLVVLDNCEHVLAGVGPLASAVLGECLGVRILATSREGLAVAGEHVWPLRSLPVPSVSTPLETIASDDAVRLFSDRAEAARSSFRIDDSNVAAIAEICRRLDGIPLAIELAAARVVALSPAEIATRLDERFRLLSGGRRSAMERHQTLRATVEWSYSSLTEYERVVFDRLAVFSGTFDISAAEAVVAGDGIEAWDVVDALVGLVAKSMVIAEDVGSSTRYLLLETMRQYAREQLDAAGDSDRWRRRHAEYFVEFAESIRLPLEGPEEVIWRERLNVEIDNLRAAVTWALDAGAPDDQLAVRVVAALGYESYRSRVRGIGGWAERAIDAAQQAPPPLRTAALGAAAWSLLAHGEPEAAGRLAEDAIRDGLPFGCPAPVAPIQTLAVSQLFRGEVDRAVQTFLDAHDAVEAAGATMRDHVILHAGASSIATAAGDSTLARSEAEKAVGLARQVGNPAALASSLTALAQALEHDDPEAALAAAQEGIALSRSGAGTQVFAGALAQAARLHVRLGDPTGALGFMREAVWHCHTSGDLSQLPMVLDNTREVFTSLGQHEAVALVCGVIDAQKIGGGGALSAAQSAERHEALARARAELGPESSTAAYDRGSAMTYQQIIDYTLFELDQISAEAALP